MRVPNKRVKPAVVLCVVVLLSATLAACRGDDAPGTVPPADAVELTEPGTTLALGESATVPLGEDHSTLVRLTVRDITQGRSADLAELERPRSNTETPYYVNYELELVEAESSPYLPIYQILSAWAGDSSLTGLTVLAPFGQCREKTFPAEAEVGTVLSGCATYVVEKGDPAPDRIMFENDEDYSGFDGTQINWE